MKNKPRYGIESVDHALRLIALLQQEGPLRLTDAAARLGLARSTTHRLLAMLLYRDFAEQDDRRRYAPGSALRRPVSPEPVSELRRIALPHLRELMETTHETVNLQVVTGDRERFVATVESDQVLRVGNREGRMLPAHLASVGQAVLATLPEEEVTRLYSGDDSPVSDVPKLLRELRAVRRRGFAVNDRRTEDGLTAIGRALHGTRGRGAAAGVSIAMPTVRFRRDRLPHWVRALEETATRIDRDLAALPDHVITP